MRFQEPNDLAAKGQGERGAALITAILLSTLLLAAGGTLILTTTLTATTGVGSTAEMQAYYAAEAGVVRTLGVLRGNVQSDPAGTTATFRNVVSTPGSWIVTSGDQVSIGEASNISFRVQTIIDVDDEDGSIRTANPAYEPNRLRIQIAGFGPMNAEKHMEVVVNRFIVNYPVASTITLPNQSGTPMSFNLGNSTVTAYSGLDASGDPSPAISAFGVDSHDSAATQAIIDGGNPNVSDPNLVELNDTNTPDFLKSVASVRSFLYGNTGMMTAAVNQGRYFTSGAAAISSPAELGASNPRGVLTFVDGDLVLGPGSPTGQGTLIVTGTLTLQGNFNFNGVIMVLGGGTVLRSGGGNGNIYGAIFVAKFDRTGLDTDLLQPPTFDTSGGGTANIQYNSAAVEMAKATGGHSVLGVREF